MAIEKFQFMNEAGMLKFATELLSKANARVNERIVTELNENSSDKQTLSAKALYTLVSNMNGSDNDDAVLNALSARVDEQNTTIGEHTDALEALNESEAAQDEKLEAVEGGLGDLTTKVGDLVHLNIETITGDITSVTDPADDILYFQRDNEADTMWMLYIYQNGEWVNIGDTEVDLSVIWSKDENDDLKEALGMHDVEAMDEATITSLIDTAYANTEEEL